MTDSTMLLIEKVYLILMSRSYGIIKPIGMVSLQVPSLSRQVIITPKTLTQKYQKKTLLATR